MASAAALGSLVLLGRDGREKTRFPLEGTTSFGRSRSNNVRIKNDTVSSVQATLSFDDKDHAILEVHSDEHKTLVNRKPVARGRVLLRSGDVVTVGARDFRFCASGAGSSLPLVDRTNESGSIGQAWHAVKNVARRIGDGLFAAADVEAPGVEETTWDLGGGKTVTHTHIVFTPDGNHTVSRSRAARNDLHASTSASTGAASGDESSSESESAFEDEVVDVETMPGEEEAGETALGRRGRAERGFAVRVHTPRGATKGRNVSVSPITGRMHLRFMSPDASEPAVARSHRSPTGGEPSGSEGVSVSAAPEDCGSAPPPPPPPPPMPVSVKQNATKSRCTGERANGTADASSLRGSATPSSSTVPPPPPMPATFPSSSARGGRTGTDSVPPRSEMDTLSSEPSTGGLPAQVSENPGADLASQVAAAARLRAVRATPKRKRTLLGRTLPPSPRTSILSEIVQAKGKPSRRDGVRTPQLRPRAESGLRAGSSVLSPLRRAFEARGDSRRAPALTPVQKLIIERRRCIHPDSPSIGDEEWNDSDSEETAKRPRLSS